MNKLRKVLFVFFISSILFSFIGCFLDQQVIHAAGEIKKIKKDFSDYSAIKVGSGFKLIIKQDGSESVEIEASDNLFQHIIAEQKGESISFYFENGIRIDRSIPVKIFVSVKKIKALSGSGGSEIKVVNGLKIDDLAVELSGGSEMKSEIESNNFAIEISGGSKITLSGSSKDFIVSSSGGSQVKAPDLSVENFTADLSGGSNVNLIVNGNLVVDASGGSQIYYTGNGVVKASELTGGSEINKK